MHKSYWLLAVSDTTPVILPFIPPGGFAEMEVFMKREFEYYNLIHTHGTHTHEHSHKKQKKNIKHKKIPVTVIGGFLGSGKTSLVNHILTTYSEKNIDVLVREYGSVSIDNMLINIDERRLHIFPGVSLHFDPQIMLYGFMDRLSEESGDGIEHLMVETSGMDWPEYMLKLFMMGNMREEYRLASYITIVDAEYAHLNMDEYSLVKSQIAYADVILLNKIDLISMNEIESVIKRIKNINACAQIYKTSYCRTDTNKIMEIELYEQLKNFDSSEKKYVEEYSMDEIKTVVLSQKEAMDKDKINAWLDRLFKNKNIKLLRSKGFFYFNGSDYRYEFQGVRTSFHSKADRKWKEGEERKSTVVLIGENLEQEKIKKEFEKCICTDKFILL